MYVEQAREARPQEQRQEQAKQRQEQAQQMQEMQAALMRALAAHGAAAQQAESASGQIKLRIATWNVKKMATTKKSCRHRDGSKTRL